MIVERGLGGNDADLADRLESFRRDRVAARRATCAGWRRGWARMAGAGRSAEAGAGEMSDRAPAGARLPGAHRQGARRNPASSCSPTAAAPISMRPIPWRGRRSWSAAELSGAASSTRILLAAAADEADVLAAAGQRIRETEEIEFDEGAAALSARRVRRLDAIVLDIGAARGGGDRGDRAPAGRGHREARRDRLPWSKAQLQLRDRVGFLRARRRGGMAGPRRCGARQDGRGVARAISSRARRSCPRSAPTTSARRSMRCCHGT